MPGQTDQRRRDKQNIAGDLIPLFIYSYKKGKDHSVQREDMFWLQALNE